MNKALVIKEAFLAGASLLYKNREYINELNVFPVPDGDTGTNMSMTLKSACDMLASSNDTIEDVCKAIASGSLRGARGNSGVIMSQILRGFTNHIKDEMNLSYSVVFDAITEARLAAYKAVVKPKEGTILTIIRALAEKTEEVKTKKIPDIEKLEKIVSYGDEMLAKTPDMLPILKEAGVVDSGGQGLMYFAHGVLSYLKGEKVDIAFDEKSEKKSAKLDLKAIEETELKFGYCTECIINSSKGFKKDATSEITDYLEKIGDSLVVVGDDEYIKIHVHTNHPGKVFEKCLEYGFLTSLKVDNLKLEHHERVIKNQEKKVEPKPTKLKNIGFITVSSGDGLTALFNDLGCDKIITGGQTMNPSTEDFIKAIDEVNAKNIFILPNNSNIIMAAKQAADCIKDKNVVVIPTKKVLQGLNSLMYFTESKDMEEMIKSFDEIINNMKTIEVTYAVRDTSIDGISIKKNDFLSLGDKGLLSADKDICKSIFEAYDKVKTDSDSIISIYYGEEKKETDANKLKKEFEKRFPNVEVNVYEGKQPVYYYYISVE